MLMINKLILYSRDLDSCPQIIPPIFNAYRANYEWFFTHYYIKPINS